MSGRFAAIAAAFVSLALLIVSLAPAAQGASGGAPGVPAARPTHKPRPTASPTPLATATPVSTPTATPTATATPTPTPSPTPAPSYYNTIFNTSGLISYWRLGETNGTVAADEMKANPGTYVGSPTLGVPGTLSGDPNTAVAFNGSSQYLRAGSSPTMAAITLEVWAKTSSWVVNSAMAGQWAVTGAMLYVVDANHLGFYLNDTYTITAVAPSAGAWHHIVGTFNGTQGRLYVDGSLVAGPTSAAFSLPNVFSEIGTYNNASGAKFGGSLDEVAVYNRALSATEVLNHYALGSPYLEGLDVSVWQGTIDWSQVAAAGKKFAIIRASAGSLTADTQYAANRSGAKAAGLRIAAYHYANPDTATDDALNEANWFLQNATPTHGEMIPALDVEVTNGLSVSEMQTWVSTWLARVSSVTGVKPMIYSSPNFWATSMGDTRQFADAGYKVLWIAHWTSASQPTVPAANWGGNGWTFWQYTSSGAVPGVTGNVDLDRYKGTTLASSLFIP